ncbi:DWNN-domain-containing protein [Meredithblackwellia eburnea MCA 4105]
MSSVVFYRFKSQKEPSRVAFEGTGISVWDLKKEIILENKMGKGNEFDFAIYNGDTEEEYTNDHFIIPRSTSVLARRLPPARPGRGNAQNYMVQQGGGGVAQAPGGGQGGGGGAGQRWDKGSMSRRFDGRDEKMESTPTASTVQIPTTADSTEADAMAAMFAASSQQWKETQEGMAKYVSVHYTLFNNRGRDGEPIVHKPPPLGYICYRCGQKGHWIQDCPTNDDRSYDDRPKIKRTTGIPKSFLTTVDGPGEAGSTGVMVTSEGGFVVAKPDNASWLAHRALSKNLSASDVQNLPPQDPDLTCPICSKLLRDATLTPCCSTSFCDECIRNALGDNDMLCPECESRVKNLSKLGVDEGRRERVNKYIEEIVNASREIKEEEEGEEEEAEEGEAKEQEGESRVKQESEGVKPDSNVGESEVAVVVKEEVSFRIFWNLHDGFSVPTGTILEWRQTS